MLIRVTAKLAKKIRVAPKHRLPLHANPYVDWSGNLFWADRVEYLLLTNTASLYSMVMPAKGLTSEAVFAEKAIGLIAAVLGHYGHQSIFDRLIASVSAEMSFSKALNRSVTGSMNDLIIQAKVSLLACGETCLETSLRLNSTPMSKLKCVFPEKAFPKLIEEPNIN